MKFTDVLIALLIASTLTVITITAFVAYKDSLSYGFWDDSIPGETHRIELDGYGGYEMNFLNSAHEVVFFESGTYSDSGGDEITLTNSDGRTYKIRVWNRASKQPRFSLRLEQ